MPPAPSGTAFVTPGDQQIFVQFRGGSPVPLGWAVQSPEFEETPKYSEIYADFAGRLEPAQAIYDGTSALASITLGNLDLEVLRAVRDPSARSGIATAGSDGALARGSLVLGVSDFSLIIKNRFFGTPQAAPGLAAGRKYFSVTLAGYKESAAGTRAMECACVFRCWNLRGDGSNPNQAFRLFTENQAELGV